MKDARELIIEQMKKEALKPGDSDRLSKLYEQYGFLLTKEISAAISPVDVFNAPITIAYLEGYAEALRKEYPEAIPLVEELKKMRSMTIARKVD